MISGITDEPHPPILNNAVIEWVSFYIGDKGFSGPKNLNQMAIYATDINLDTHLYNVHTLKEDPLVNRIKEAANLDSIQV